MARDLEVAAGVEEAGVDVSVGSAAPSGGVMRWRRRGFEALPATERAGRRWSELALAAHDVPLPAHRSAGRLGDVAVASSGFRDEYYGLVSHVHDDSSLAEDRGVSAPHGCADGATARSPVGRQEVHAGGGGPRRVALRPLITSGLIDAGRCAWGERTVRFAKQTFARPVVDLDALLADAAMVGGPTARAAAWVVATSGPKVIVATQTRVGEAAVDESGSWVPSTPTVVVRCRDSVPVTDVVPGVVATGAVPGVPGADVLDRLWALAAVVCSPLGTVVALADTFGTARSVQAIKPSATSVLDLPLPVDPGAWSAGAVALRRRDRNGFAAAMAAAYDIDDHAAVALHSWWAARVPW